MGITVRFLEYSISDSWPLLFFFVIFVTKIIKDNNMNVYDFVVPGDLGSYGVLHLSENYHTRNAASVLFYMEHNGHSPMYISDALTPVSRVPSRGRLRLPTQQTTWCQEHVLSSGREHSVFPGLWSGTLSPSHCELSIPSQRFVAG